MDVFFVLDIIGTAIFAYSGALAARGHGYHILGILYIALLTAVGGGTVRNLLLQTPGLFWLESSAYGWAIVSAAGASYFLKVRTNSVLFYLLDSFSLAVFISLGFSQAFGQTGSIPVAFAMGILSGIGGGLIRDAITSQPPQALSDPVYPFMMVAGAAGSLLATHLGLPIWTLSVALVLAVAIISTFTRERLPAVVAEVPITTALQNGHTQVKSSQAKHTVARSFAKAVTVITIASATSLYFFEPTSSTAVANSASQTTSHGRLLDEYITLARWQLENNNLAGATTTIDEASRLNPQHHLLLSLRVERDELQTYQRHIADAEAALNAEDLNKFQKSMEMAAAYDRHGNKFSHLQSALNTRLNLVEIERKSQALAASSVELHIASAKQHLSHGNFDAATNEVTMAKSYGIQTNNIAIVEKDIQQQLAIFQAALSDSDIDYAEKQFWKLQRAIELRNLTAIKALTSDDNDRHNLFNKLFDRYVEINVQLTQISTLKKNVSARLELKTMRLPDGNLTYPASDYGVIALNLLLTEKGWTKIQW